MTEPIHTNNCQKLNCKRVGVYVKPHPKMSAARWCGGIPGWFGGVPGWFGGAPGWLGSVPGQLGNAYWRSSGAPGWVGGALGWFGFLGVPRP